MEITKHSLDKQKFLTKKERTAQLMTICGILSTC